MKHEDRKLLIKDLCARQMHNVKCRVKYSFNNETTNGRDVWTEDDDTIKMVNPEYEEVFISYISEWVDIENVKPYLRPMQSMTKGEKEEYRKLCKKVVRKLYVADGKSWPSNKTTYRYFGTKTEYYDTYQSIDYLISRHFDYRGLIPKGLALEATEDMYKEK